MTAVADILWVDDELDTASGLISEVQLLSAATISFASTASMARWRLDHAVFKIVILDMYLGADSEGGRTVLQYIADRADENASRGMPDKNPTVIIFTASIRAPLLIQEFPRLTIHVGYKGDSLRDLSKFIERELRDRSSV
jgi:DNA-binding NtrC family response regulator